MADGRYDAELVGGRYVLHRLFRVAGVWYARARDTRTGKTRKKSLRTRKKREAKERAREWLESFGQPDIEASAVAVALEEWIDLKTVRPSTLADLRKSAEKVYAPAFSGLDVDEVRPEHVERLLKRLADDGRATRTRQKHLTALRSFFRWAMRRGYTELDPTDGIRVPRGAKREGRALTIEEARKLVAACRRGAQKVEDDRRGEFHQRFGLGDRLRLAVLISLYTGLRRENVLGLRWSRVDLEGRRISIPADAMKAHRAHEVPIHPALAEELAGAKRRRKRRSVYVLSRRYRSLHSGLHSALDRAGLDRIRWHDLRHTFATWMASRSTFACLQALLGHSPRTVTVGYVHVPWEERSEAVEKLPDLRLS